MAILELNGTTAFYGAHKQSLQPTAGYYWGRPVHPGSAALF